MVRPELKDMVIDRCCKELRSRVSERLAEKGPGIFVSRHEIVGIVAEEYDEMLDAVRRNSSKELRHELLDVAVAAIIGMASIDTDCMDW